MPLSAVIPKEFSPEFFPISKGVKVQGNTVLFGNSYTKESAERLLASFWEKSVPHGNGSSYIVKKIKGEGSLALKRADIETLGIKVPAEFTDEEYSFYRMSEANTKMDRQGDKLTRRFLERMALNTMENGGINILYNHSNDHALGHLFYEEVKRMATGAEDYEMVGYMAINKKASMPNHPNMTVDEGIKSKMLNHVSIGFMARGETKEVGDTLFTEFDYMEGQAIMPEHFETSLVYFPAQYGAKIKEFKGEVTEFDSKIFQLKNITKKTFLMSFEIEINGKKLPITPDTVEKDGASSVTIKGLDAVQTEIKALETKASKYDALEKLFIDSNTEAINDIQNLEGEKALNKSYKHTADELKGMLLSAPEKFKAVYADLKAEHVKAIKAGQLGAPAGTEKTESKPFSRFN